MSDKRTIWEHPIIAGVSVAAIVGLAIWIFPSVQAISKSVLAFVLGILGTPIPLWVGLLGFVLSVAAISIKRRIDRWIDGPRELIEETSTAESVEQVVQQQSIESKELEKEISRESDEPELDEVQTEIMRRFANRDTGRLSIGNLYDGVPFTRLRVDQAVRGLEEFGFLERAMVRGHIYILTAEGTDYIVEQGWAK